MAGAEWAATARRMDDAYDILAAEHPMTIRQIFYRLVSKALIKNCQRHYARVGRDMTKARKDGRVPECIVDRSRRNYEPNVFDDLAGYGLAIQRSDRQDHWRDQPDYVEVWLEKDSVSGRSDP